MIVTKVFVAQSCPALSVPAWKNPTVQAYSAISACESMIGKELSEFQQIWETFKQIVWPFERAWCPNLTLF
jgi:hypothetical protein